MIIFFYAPKVRTRGRAWSLPCPYCRSTQDHPGSHEGPGPDKDRAEAKVQPGSLLCKHCLRPITSLDQRIFVLDSQKHIFSNPHGLLFEIGCFSSAPGCLALGQKTSKFTWFPGYAWQIAVCGGCREHMGWLYAGQGTSFFGLRLDQLVLAAPGPK